MSFYFLVAFNLNKGASTSVATSSKTRWGKNWRATLTVAKHLCDISIGRKMYLGVWYVILPCYSGGDAMWLCGSFCI